MTIRDQTGGHAPPLCLEAGIFDGLKSRPSFFDKHFQTSTAEALELCRTLNVLRRMGIQDHQTSQIALYLQKAKYVTESQEEESGISPEAVRAMECHWTSPCSGSGDRYHTLVGLKTDMHMALFMMAAGMMKEAGSRSAVVLQQQQEDAEAEAELAALMGGEAEPEAATGSSSSGGGGVDELQECVKLLQKAAGVFRHLSHDLLPQLTDLPTNHPAELSTELADAMHIAALACSHAVAAHRACEFLGKTPELAAMLYAGASDMFERAATKVSALRSTKMEVGTNFRKYLAVSSAYYHARAYEYHGVAQCSCDDVGSGCASITEALRRLEECRSAVDGHREWKDAIQKAVSHAASLKQQYNEDRQLLHFQPEAAAAKKLPPARNFIQPQSFCLDSLRDWFSNADFMPGAV